MKSKQSLILVMALLGASVFARQTEPVPQRVQRTEAIAMGNLIEVVPPQYPEEIRKEHTGKVVLKILIDKAGKVTEASPLSGDPLLADATVSAVKQWKFRPYLLSNEHVEVDTTATVAYTAGPPYVITPNPFQGPRMIRVSQGVMESSIVRQVQPQYPQEAKANHVKGDVLIQAIIDEKGSIAKMTVLKGEPVLAKAATEAVAQWKYKPFTIGGDPVEVETTILVRFHM